MIHAAAAKFVLGTQAITVDGVLTTEHPASNYGKPVFVPNWSFWHFGDDVPTPPDVLGAADVQQIALTIDPVAMWTDTPERMNQALASGGWPLVQRIS